MTSYSERALALLKQKGYRITKPRRLVLDILEKSDRSLSPYDIKDVLDAAGEHVDTVSIYRILECLEENHLIHRMLLQYGKVLRCTLEDETHCHLHQSDHCHHFLICEQCGDIQEIHCVGLNSIVQDVTERTGFQVKHHHLEFVGLCPQCAS